MKVTVLGSGAWGTALAIVLVENGNDVTMWSHRREAVAEMQQLGVNPKLKGVPLPKELHLSSDLSCVSDSDVVFCNDAKLFHFSYQRYLENQIRNTFGLEGTPIRLIIRAKGEKGDL